MDVVYAFEKSSFFIFSYILKSNGLRLWVIKIKIKKKFERKILRDYRDHRYANEWIFSSYPLKSSNHCYFYFVVFFEHIRMTLVNQRRNDAGKDCLYRYPSNIPSYNGWKPCYEYICYCKGRCTTHLLCTSVNIVYYV